MLYIISGASRAGKTIIAKRISAEKGISYFSLDWLVMGFTNGIPKYGIHDMLFPDEIAERSWPFLKAMLESMIWTNVDYIIEGEAILPELITELLKKYPNKIKVCFLGFTDIAPYKKAKEIKHFSSEENDWLNDKSEEYVLDHVKNMIAHSRKIKASCKKHDLNYFETSADFMDTVKSAVDYLIN